MRFVCGKLKVAWLVVPFLLGSCGASIPKGAVAVKVIQPDGSHCGYTIKSAVLTTMSDLSTLSGRIGSVVTSDLNLAASSRILEEGRGFFPIDGQFLLSGDVFSPKNYTTLYGASLYYAIESAYLAHARLDPSADFASTDPEFSSKTLFVMNALETFKDQDGGSSRRHDNAAYLARTLTRQGKPAGRRNYIVTYPTQSTKGLPLGLNAGILAHEYTHLVFESHFNDRARKRGVGLAGDKPTMATLRSINEGIADYFGFMATKDPGFFVCSFPRERRDLSVPKALTRDLAIRMASETTYDEHEGGAVFAAINYQIGREIGFDVNAALLEKLMGALLTCPTTQAAGSTNSLDMDFAAVAACHASLDKTHASTISRIYAKYSVPIETLREVP